MPPKDKKKKGEDDEPEVPQTGSGKFYYENGATYDGEWIMKKFDQPDDPKAEPPPPEINRHGKGVYTDGDYVYEGEFVYDKMEGQGKFTYASGATYEGEWKEGEYHGQGTFTWPDGRNYTGAWEHNKMHGLGVYTDIEKHKWEGQFHVGSGPGLTCDLS